MPAANALKPAERKRILALHADGMSRNDIARTVKRSSSTVTRIVHEAGGTFDRTATKAATEARKADLAEKRALLREKYLQRADELLEQMTQPCVVFNFGGKDNTYAERRLDKPPVKDLRDLMQAASTATSAEIRISQADTGQQTERVRSLLTAMADGLGINDSPADDA